jgi:N-methylhydantoinase A/oxoprolinase/acetone carboxylase beta subunit
MTRPRRIGSDTGGTFTDLVLDDGRIAKVPSTPTDPALAVGAGLRALLGAAQPAVLAHGTTVATNALLERRGARVALVTNEGFADLIEIARQDRPSLYDQTVDRPAPIVPRPWRYEVRGRLGAAGEEIVPLDLSTLPELDPSIDAVAVCLLHSDVNPAHERAVADELAQRGFDVTASHELSPEFREYERMTTTVINAYVRPLCGEYLLALEQVADEVLVMTSGGGLTTAAGAAARPAALLLSGPAGGVLAAAAIAAANGFDDAITFDMGGTSTDVCLVTDGRPEPAAEREVAGFPVRLPSLDVHTIGAGGGSIAVIDDGGALVVGPQSAGARPGPASYGHGGDAATVTDANLVAGHIPAGAVLPGLGALDLDAAQRVLDEAHLTAEGVIAVVNANMEHALRKVSIERGVDPRGLALVAYGGAGPLHACALADALEMAVVIVPPRAGVFSAVGILGAPLQADAVVSWPTPLDHEGLPEAAEQLVRACVDRLGAPPGDDWLAPGNATSVAAWLDCRYEGQSHELRVESVEAFHAQHEQRNGYARPQTPVEVVALRASAWRDSPIDVAMLPDVVRESATGPVAIAESDCTVWVADGWRAEPGAAGALVLRRVPAATR